VSRAVHSASGRHGPRHYLAQLKRVSLGTTGLRSETMTRLTTITMLLLVLALAMCSCAAVDEPAVMDLESRPDTTRFPRVPRSPSTRRTRDVPRIEFEGTPIACSVGPVPSAIVAAAWESLADKMGEDFCEAYVVYDSLQSRRSVPLEGENRDPVSQMRFHLRSLEEPLIKGEINFSVDDTGAFIDGVSTWGIPKCDKPSRCRGFRVATASEARSLAIGAGLNPGINGYSVSFDFRGREYYWYVSATYERTDTYARGQSALVNAHTGWVEYSRGDYWESSRPARQSGAVVPN